MSFSIPQLIFDRWTEVGNYLLENNNFSRVATLYYPPIKVVCTSCPSHELGGTTNNVWSHGGPAPFSYNSCTYCGGAGYKEQEVTSTIRLRAYFNRKSWIKVGTIVSPDSEVQVIGKITDLPAIRQAATIELLSEDNNLNLTYILDGEPFPHGFGKNNFFIAFLKKS